VRVGVGRVKIGSGRRWGDDRDGEEKEEKEKVET